MENAKIKAVKFEDINECVHVIRQAFLPKAIQYGFTKETYPSSGAFIERETLEKSLYDNIMMYAVWIENRIVGYVQLVKKSDDEYMFQKFAVLPKFQQFGIGKILINFAKEKVLSLKAEKITLIMVSENEELKNFYIANGFKIIGFKFDEAHPFEQALMECVL